MGATRKFRNRSRNRTRGSQQSKLARAYVRAELIRQTAFALLSPEATRNTLQHGVMFRNHPQFGWCENILSNNDFVLVLPESGQYRKIARVLFPERYS